MFDFNQVPKFPIPKQNSILLIIWFNTIPTPKYIKICFFIDLITQLKYFFEILLFRRRKKKGDLKEISGSKLQPQFFWILLLIHKYNCEFASGSHWLSSSQGKFRFWFRFQFRKSVIIRIWFLLTGTGIRDSSNWNGNRQFLLLLFGQIQ